MSDTTTTLPDGTDGTGSKHWTVLDIPDQTGRVAVVTGANSGVGYETARWLAKKGATVVMACRDHGKGEAAARRVRDEGTTGDVEMMQLDLDDLDSVRAFAGAFKGLYQALHMLINNAGVMHPPFGKTRQGFETQFGVNHLGHFALTGLLLDVIVRTPGARIVTLSSGAHRMGRIDFDNLNAEQGYRANAAYAQSKLANLLFTHELQRKLEAAGKDTIAVAAHPGWTATNLQQHSGLLNFLNQFFAQTPDMGALPTLRAATAPDVHGGDYYGPSRRMEIVGYPKKVGASRRSHDETVAAQLWEISEEMTGVIYPLESKSV